MRSFKDIRKHFVLDIHKPVTGNLDHGIITAPGSMLVLTLGIGFWPVIGAEERNR